MPVNHAQASKHVKVDKGGGQRLSINSKGAEADRTTCDVEQIRSELDSFRQSLLHDIHHIFETSLKHHLSQTPAHLSQTPAPYTSDSVAYSSGQTGNVHTGNGIVLAIHSETEDAKDNGLNTDWADVLANDDAADPEDVQEEDEDDELEARKVKKMVGVFGDLGTQNNFDLAEPTYNVMNFYKTEGPAQRMARSHQFDNITLAVICANAVYLGVDADNNTESYILDYKWYFQMCENAFCVFFTGELLTRFLAFKHKRNCMRDGWFKFDSLLVGLMLLETWIMPCILTVIGGKKLNLPTGPLRLLRLLRLSRLVRLIRQLPELMTMFKGMFVASRAVGSSLLMVMLLIYVFGIIVHMLLNEEASMQYKFKSLPLCMWTLLMDGTFMDSTGTVLTELVDLAKFNTVAACFVFLCFILLSAMTVMNMLIGVLCEVVSTVAQGERDEAAIQLMKDSILVELKQFDNDGNGMISKGELRQVMKSKHALGVLRSIEVDDDCLYELQQMLFYNKGDDAEVQIERVMELLLMYRGNLSTTVKHLVEAQAFTRWHVNDHMRKHAEHTESMLKDLGRHLCCLISAIPARKAAAPAVCNSRQEGSQRIAVEL